MSLDLDPGHPGMRVSRQIIHRVVNRHASSDPERVKIQGGLDATDGQFHVR